MKTRIKELRIQKKLTQAGLAIHAGCSQNQISRIELGECNPTADILLALAKFFDVSVDYLLCETEYRYKSDYYIESGHQRDRYLDYYIRYSRLPDKYKKPINDIMDCVLNDVSKPD